MSHYAGSVPDTLTRTTDWLTTAPCRTDPDTMFDTTDAGVEAAKEFCRRCPAVERCLQWALDTGEEHGVWGGMSEDERRPLRQDVMAKRSGTTRCLEAQAFIEKRLEDGASERQVSEEVGVWPSTLRRALVMFAAEREEQTA